MSPNGLFLLTIYEHVLNVFDLYDIADLKNMIRRSSNYLPCPNGQVFDDVTSKTENLMPQNMDILYTIRRVFKRRLRKTSVPISKNACTKRYKGSKF